MHSFQEVFKKKNKGQYFRFIDIYVDELKAIHPNTLTVLYLQFIE